MTDARAIMVRWLPWLLALAFLMLWQSPVIVAYDDHLTPSRLILEHRRLPAIDECWECHQPPLYYLAGAAALALRRDSAGEISASRAFAALKTLALLFSLGSLALLAALTRRFFPDDPSAQLVALAVAGLTPVFLLSVVMLGNDSAVLFFALLFCWLAAPGPRGGRLSRGRVALLGAVAGAAVLSKYNGFALLPAGLGVVLWRGRHEGLPARALWVRVAVAAAAFLALTGPWFARNMVATGSPIPTRMGQIETIDSERYDLFSLHPLALLRTPFELRARIAPGATRPYLAHQVLTAADTSLWTKTYASWWSDAFYYLPQPAPGWTVARYLAALPVCLMALAGVGLAAWALVRRPRARQRGVAPVASRAGFVAPVLLTVSLLGLYFAFVARYPWVRLGHGRASFLLPLIVPFALGVGLGYAALARRCRAAAIIPVALLVALTAHYALFLGTYYF